MAQRPGARPGRGDTRRTRSALLPGVCAVLNLAMLMPYYVPSGSPGWSGETGSANVLRVATVNLYAANRRFDLLERFVTEANPDMLVLVEVNPAWARGLSGIRSRLPHGMVHPTRGTNGIALLSRHPCVRCEVRDPADIDAPIVIGEMRLRGRGVTIVGTHLPVPSTPLHAALMDLQIESIGQFLEAVDGDKVLPGDLNTTPWSAYFRRLTAIAHLRDSAEGRGVPIDHVLISSGLRVIRRTVGPFVGSDHLPVVVDIAWP